MNSLNATPTPGAGSLAVANHNGVATANGSVSASGSEASVAAANGSGTGSRSIEVDWEALARSTAHPLRISILEILGIDGGRVLSPSELSRELQIPLSNTNYHVTELAKAGLIELVRQRQVRGATEHFYRLPGIGGDEEFEAGGAPESDRLRAL